MRSVLLFSGGLDSTVALFKLRAEGIEVRPLSINYGQRHLVELRHAHRICRSLGLELKELDSPQLHEILSGSSQTSEDIAVPEGHYTEESMKLTVVPNRNMIMLSLAIGWAVSLKFDSVTYAAHSGDHTIYPDCRPEFIKAVDNCAQLCDWHPVRVEAPFQGMSKADIVRLGLELDVPFKDTWSCYKGKLLHCGRCGTCVERKEAFEKAGLEDPTEYEDL
jgi:7-cyano-7-deazaguanine synthase